MFNKLIAASAFSLLMATGAMAQTGAASGDTTGSSAFTSPVEAEMMQNWTGPVGQTFFTDDTMTTMRSQEEITTGWASLTVEQQQAVRDDCTNVTGDTSNSYGKSVVDLCTMVGGM